MSNYMQVFSLHPHCRNAEGRFKKILFRALFRLRCFQNDFRAILQAAVYFFSDCAMGLRWVQ